ncbi:hypothetical protein LRP52_00375 [Photobacterium sp. ZSDE20]|uniref:Lipoprotein n=1 Tax=Photobacterium pectinilyticum TaxID=2906793 RepID=A0ABT1MXW3_9GAMM|nr:hypothetical protein [Photobacterium sp. ZSDE20]MCQ1056519.1 hypothetical protein [Photobacterium sp. ZSDE20]MDD1820654.1 hypothetical protein [Photobacterium sp. ZSDE20]
MSKIISFILCVVFLVACSSNDDVSEQTLALNLSGINKISESNSTVVKQPHFEFRSKQHIHYWQCSSASDCYTEYSGSFFLHDLDTGVVPRWASIETDLRTGTCKDSFEVSSSSDNYHYQMNSQYPDYGWNAQRDSRIERVVGKSVLRSPIYGIWEVVWKSEACN